MMPKIEERLTICASRCLRKMRQERAGAAHHAPEIDVEQPFHLRLVDLVEVAEQRDAGIVDDDVEAGMGGDAACAKASICAGSPTSTRCIVTLRGRICRSRRRPPAAPPRRGRRAPDRSRARPAPAPAPGRCHWRRRSRRPRFRIAVIRISMRSRGKSKRLSDFRKWEPNHKAAFALNLDYLGRNRAHCRDCPAPGLKTLRATALAGEGDPMQRGMIRLHARKKAPSMYRPRRRGDGGHAHQRTGGSAR